MTLSERLQLFYNATLIPVSYFSQKTLIEKYSHNIHDFNLSLLFFSSLPEEMPDAWYSFTPEYMYFGGIRLPKKEQVLVLGPVLMRECSLKQAGDICNRLGLDPKERTHLQHFFGCSHPHDTRSLSNNLQLLGTLAGVEVKLPLPCIPLEWNIPFPITGHPSSPTFFSWDESAALEQNILTCIYFGDLLGIDQILHHSLAETQQESTANLATLRTYTHSAYLLASRVVRFAGLDPHIVDAICNDYNDQILNAKDTSELNYIFTDMLRKCTKTVAELHSLPGSSPIIRKLQQYVRLHVDEKLSAQILADVLHLNVSYLCTHFKKETDMTIGDYIQKEKIREAKRLLLGSRFSIAEISESLAFSSESYFCAIFKKTTGMTPMSYRTSKPFAQ